MERPGRVDVAAAEQMGPHIRENRRQFVGVFLERLEFSSRLYGGGAVIG